MARKVVTEQGSSHSRFVIALDEYEGHRYLDLREWFLEKKTKKWRPKKKGITLNRDRFRVVLELVEQKSEEVMDWLGIGYVPEHVARYVEAQEQAAITNEFVVGDLEISTHSERRDPRFFRVDHRGNTDKVSLNTEHRIASKLSDPDQAWIVGAMLAAFSRARVMLGDAPATDPEILFEQLEQDWARYLQDYLRE
jgi:hypothetical protein